MVKVARILRDYRRGRRVNALLALWGFVDDHDLPDEGRARRRGVPAARASTTSASPPQRQAIVHRFEAALRLLDEHCRRLPVRGQTAGGALRGRPCALRRRRSAPATGGVPERKPPRPLRAGPVSGAAVRGARRRPAAASTLDGFAVPPGGPPRLALDEPHADALLEGELDRAIVTCIRKRRRSRFNSRTAVAPPCEGRRLPLLRHLVNYDAAKVAQPSLVVRHASGLLRRRLSDRVPPRSSDVVGTDVKVLSMKEPPAQTFAHTLGDLSPAGEVHRVSRMAAHAERPRCAETSSRRRRHFFNKRVSLINYSPRRPGLRRCLSTILPRATVRELGDA